MRRPQRPTPDAGISGDEELAAALAAAREGDEAAFTVIYRTVAPRLLRYLRVLLAGEPDVAAAAEDVAAEAWLQIVRDLAGFRGGADEFRAWTATIARHRALDHHRRLRARPRAADVALEDLPDAPGTEDAAEAALARIGTDRAIALLATLPRDQAEAVVLRAVVGLDAAAAAAVLGKRAGAVRMAAHRGLATLAARLRDVEGANGQAADLHRSEGVTEFEAPALKEVR